MRAPDRIRIAKLLTPQMPGFVVNKRGNLFVAPIGNVLRGFLFESTANARQEFYFWWFFMPICGPVDHIGLGNGARLNVPGGNSGWRADMEHLPEKLLEAMHPVLPFLRSMSSNMDTINALYQRRGQEIAGPGSTRKVTDIHVQHDVACLYILDGQFDKAKPILDDVIAHEHGSDRRQWLLDIVERMKGLREKLLASPQLAVAQVKEWQDFTFKALKLEQWR